TFLFWTIVLTYLFNYNKGNLKLSKNQLSGVHAVIVIFSFLVNIESSYLYYITFSYYLLDGIFQFYNSRKFYNFGLVIHHIFSFFFLFNNIYYKYNLVKNFNSSINKINKLNEIIFFTNFYFRIII